MKKLKGAAQMVANMLKRDNTPVRTEAAEALLVDVANVESKFTTMQNQLETMKRDKLKADELLEKVTKHWEEEIAAFSSHGELADKVMVKDVKAARSYLNKRNK